MLDLLFGVWTRRGGDWMDRILSLVMWAGLTLLTVGLGWGAYTLVDVTGVEVNDVKATVQAKWHTAPYTTYIMVNKIMVPQYHPARNMMKLCIHTGECDNVSVLSGTWDHYNIGDPVIVYYKAGRLSDKFIITGFCTTCTVGGDQ